MSDVEAPPSAPLSEGIPWISLGASAVAVIAACARAVLSDAHEADGEPLLHMESPEHP